MKKFTKLFLAFAMLIIAGNASAALKEYEVDQKFTKISDLEGVLFCIVNETEGKALYNVDNQNLEYKSYSDAVSGTAYLWKIHSLKNEADAEVQSCYSLEIVNADGSSRSQWGQSPMYLNSGAPGGFDGCFVLGNGTQYGTDLKYGGVWEIEYDANNGFALKNKARGGYFTGVKPAPTGDEPAYWTFCTLKEKKSEDPLAPEKADLSDAIDFGKLQNSLGKTDASWTALQNAITAGEAQLVNESTTAELLVAATNAINDAYAGLELKDGYTNLTTDMYKTWNDNKKPTTSTSAGCAYNLNASTGQPYGDPNVYYLNFADISDFNKLYVLIAAGQARVQMNRETDGGTTHIVTSGNAVTEVDFATEKASGVLQGFDFVHLNAIKDNWGGVTATGMLLYRTVTVGATGYATFGSLYKNAKFNDGVTAYAVTYTGGKTVSLAPVTTVSAGKGVIIEAEAGEYAPTFDVEADETASDLLVSNGTVVGDGKTIYVLNKVGDNVGFYLLKAGEKLEAGKAYLVVPANSEARGFIGIDEATGINEVNVNKAAAKTGKIYNLNGQIVSKPSKGLFIVDGKVVSF